MKNFIILLMLFCSASAFARPPVNGNINISSAGATARTQLPNLTVSSCTIAAVSTNAGAVYIGGGTVTNSSGANPGFKLLPGDALSDINVMNLNYIFVAADNANDDVTYLCN